MIVWIHFRSAVMKYGMWDQVRVDHGKEFYLTLFMQELSQTWSRGGSLLSNPIHKSKNCRHFFKFVLICNCFGHLHLSETVIHHRVYTMHVQPYTICMRVNLWWHDCCFSRKVLSFSFIQNHTVERMWPEVNKRVTYPLKTALVGMANAETLDMEDSRGDSRIRPLGVLSPQWECAMNTVPCKSAKTPC